MGADNFKDLFLYICATLYHQDRLYQTFASHLAYCLLYKLVRVICDGLYITQVIPELGMWKWTDIKPCFGEISKLSISIHCEIPTLYSHAMALVLHSNLATSFSKTVKLTKILLEVF